MDRHGQLTIPASLLRDMGLAAGDTVKLAYISNAPDSIRNTFKEFVITPDGITAPAEDEESELTLPHDLLGRLGFLWAAILKLSVQRVLLSSWRQICWTAFPMNCASCLMTWASIPKPFGKS